MSKRTDYDQVYDGEWVRPVMKNYKNACCDCGLVHTMSFRVVRVGRHLVVEYKVEQDDRATAQIRRKPHKCITT